MSSRSVAPYLGDILEAIRRIDTLLQASTLEAFEKDWQDKWTVERGLEIISEASRHLTADIKARHPEIP